VLVEMSTFGRKPPSVVPGRRGRWRRCGQAFGAAAAGMAALGWCSGSSSALGFVQPSFAASGTGAISSRCTGQTARYAAAKAPVDDEDLEVWDQSIEDLALDVRELLITDGNIYFVGPDVESYEVAIREVAARINYTALAFDFPDLLKGTQMVSELEKVLWVPPVVSVQKWPWKVMINGLTVFLDPDGWKKMDHVERDKLRKLKFPKKKSAFGPEKPTEFSLSVPSEEPPADPIDMWMEADVHVDLTAHPDLPFENIILGSIIDSILRSPPKWRGWMKAAKMRGTIASDFETPMQVRRGFHSFGVSPRLNKLLKA